MGNAGPDHTGRALTLLREAAGYSARELAKRATGQTLYILDEPSTGLHAADVKRLIQVLQTLVDNGNTNAAVCNRTPPPEACLLVYFSKVLIQEGFQQQICLGGPFDKEHCLGKNHTDVAGQWFKRKASPAR